MGRNCVGLRAAGQAHGWFTMSVLMLVTGLVFQVESPAQAPARGVRTSVITGQVLGPDGVPAIGVRVLAIEVPAEGQSINENQMVVSSSDTDAAGRYRLENIVPGRYFIGAGTMDAPTLHPGVIEPSDATVVTVNAGQRINGVDFAMTARDYFTISGRVVFGKGSAKGSGIQLNDPLFESTFSAVIGDDGAFEFRRVPVGTYRVLITSSASGLSVNEMAAGLPSAPVFPEALDVSGAGDVKAEVRVPQMIPVDSFTAFFGPGGTAPTVIPPSVPPSGRPALLETRLAMIPHAPLTTPRDCGHVPTATAQPVIACVEEALRARAPFLASFEQKGIDSAVIIGLGGTAPDAVVQVVFDSKSGGGGGERTSAPRDCVAPTLTALVASVQVACH
jgi:hypothetical protein